MMLRTASCFAHRTLFSLGKQYSRVQAYSGSPVVCTQLRQTSTTVQQLRAPQLLNAAKLARISGACYLPEDELSKFLISQNLQLQDKGQTHFTRWFEADGLFPVDSATAPSQQSAASGRARVIALRGVAWRNEETQVFRLWQDLARFWPSPFAEDATDKAAGLVAHTGVNDMAEDLYKTLQPAIQDCMQTSRRLIFVGHSLGGALAVLVCALARLRLHFPASQVQCYAYGSPCVLASAANSKRSALQILGMPSSSIQSFVLENDPVPRAMLSVDPTFVYLKRFSAVQQLLQLRESWLGGQPTFSSKRFLYENVGDVHLIKWRSGTGPKVLPLSPEEIQGQLELATEELLERPATAVQALLDHWHGSYAQELENAAEALREQL